MDLKNALQSIIRSHEKDILTPLYTPWGETLDKEHVREEYPRPQMVRDNFTILNGLWDYAIASEKNPFAKGQTDGQILVPFSPESLLSGVNRQLQPGEYLWYQRSFSLDKIPSGKRLLLHFGAVDQVAKVWVNQQPVCTHSGGYLPFEADITDSVKEGENFLNLCVTDASETVPLTRGKQRLKRGGIFYTAQSGIWQTVWYEWVPERYITKLTITPDYDHAEVELKIVLNTAAGEAAFDAYAEVFDSGRCLTLQTFSRLSEKELGCRISLPNFQPWSPENPFLYALKLYAGEDFVESYFAMRHFSIETDAQGYPCFCLNHSPYFLNGVLDQSYWPDGLYTAPCDEAFIFDITTAKKLGFNMMRKHIKIEAARWYYHCDRLGMLVWQDMVNGGASYSSLITGYLPTLFPASWGRIRDHHYPLFSRTLPENRADWTAECLETVETLYNVPSIAVWVPFNEGWGQFDANAITAQIRKKDATRLIDQASGWYDQHGGDFISHHNYFRELKSYAVPTKVQLASPKRHRPSLEEQVPVRAFVLSEYGGYACHLAGHTSIDRVFGYRKYDTPEEFADAYRTLLSEKIVPLKQQGLCGAVYTQLTDIEEEVNGLITYDRKVIKVPLTSAPDKE